MCYYERKEVALWQMESEKTSNNKILHPCYVRLLNKAKTDYNYIIGFMETAKDDFSRRVYRMRLEDRKNWIQIEVETGISSDSLRNSMYRDKKRYEKEHGIKLNTAFL